MSKKDLTGVVRELVIQNPELPLFFFYSEEGVDNMYTAGRVSSAEIGQHYTKDEIVYLRSKDEDLLREYQADIFWETHFGHGSMTEEDHEQMDKLLDEYIEKLPWKDAIIVFIDPAVSN